MIRRFLIWLLKSMRPLRGPTALRTFSHHMRHVGTDGFWAGVEKDGKKVELAHLVKYDGYSVGALRHKVDERQLAALVLMYTSCLRDMMARRGRPLDSMQDIEEFMEDLMNGEAPQNVLRSVKGGKGGNGTTTA